jgi:hypothetical protein
MNPKVFKFLRKELVLVIWVIKLNKSRQLLNMNNYFICFSSINWQGIIITGAYVQMYVSLETSNEFRHWCHFNGQLEFLSQFETIVIG